MPRLILIETGKLIVLFLMLDSVVDLTAFSIDGLF